MNQVQSLIHGNANWRADAGKTAAQVADEMNAVRVVLVPGSNYTLLGVAQRLTPVFTVQLEATMEAAIPAVDAVTAIALKQYLRMLQITPGVDFGLASNQEAIEALRPIIGDALTDGLKSLGQQVQYDEVTETQVTDAWAWLAAFDARQTVASDLKREVDRLDTMLHNPGEFDAQVALIKALAEEI
jgi:hypothetical protein